MNDDDATRRKRQMKRICYQVTSDAPPGKLRPYATSFVTENDETGSGEAIGPIVYARSLAQARRYAGTHSARLQPLKIDGEFGYEVDEGGNVLAAGFRAADGVTIADVEAFIAAHRAKKTGA